MSLQFDVVVKELLGVPARTAIQLAYYRVNGAGALTSKSTLQLTNGASPKVLTLTGSKELLIKTNRKLSVTVTRPDASTFVLSVASLVLLTQEFNSISLVYADGAAAVDDRAEVTIHSA